MTQLESNMNTIALKSETVNASLSARRGQLEKREYQLAAVLFACELIP